MPEREREKKKPLRPKLSNKGGTAGPLFSLARRHDPEQQTDDGGKTPKHGEKQKANSVHGTGVKEGDGMGDNNGSNPPPRLPVERL